MIRARLRVLSVTLPAVVLIVGGAGCGGGMQYTVDDGALDQIPAGERQAVFDARREVELAQGERRTAEVQLEALERDADIADKERAQAELEVEKSAAEMQGASASKDMNRMNTAGRNKEIASMGVKVAEAKIDFLEEKEEWLEQSREAALLHVQAANAKVELEKARVAQQKGIKPSDDFNLGRFESQWKDKNSDFESARKDAASLEKDAKEMEQKWQNLSTQYAQMRGGR